MSELKIIKPEWICKYQDSEIFADSKGGALLLRDEQNVVLSTFPNRPFPCHKLYGKERPFLGKAFFGTHISRVREQADMGIGIHVIGASNYTNRRVPVELDDGRYGYKYTKPESIRSYIMCARGYGIECIPHITALADPLWKQPYNVTIDVIYGLCQEYGMCGAFLDNANAAYKPVGGSTSFYYGVDFMENILCARMWREKMGPEAALVHHRTLDPYGLYTGVRLIPQDEQFDITVVGEKHDNSPPVELGSPHWTHGMNDLNKANTITMCLARTELDPKEFAEAIAASHMMPPTFGNKDDQEWEAAVFKYYKPLYEANKARWKAGELCSGGPAGDGQA